MKTILATLLVLSTLVGAVAPASAGFSAKKFYDNLDRFGGSQGN